MKTLIRVIFLAQFFLIIVIKFYGQKFDQDTSRSCSDIMREIGYYWRLDSLANDGFRYYTYDKFLRCKIDSVNKDFLLSMLGKPNRVWEETNGTYYVYHYFDITKMPKNYNAPMACLYVAFGFGKKSGYLVVIKKGDIDM